MTESRQTSQWNHPDPPLAGNISAIALVASTTDSLDLTTCDNQTVNAQNSDQVKRGAVDCDVTIVVDGTVPIYVCFGASQAAVSGGNAPSASATGTHTTGVNITGGCVPLYPVAATGPGANPLVGYRFRIRAGYNNWIGFISSGTPTLRIFKSSPYAA